jgi:hypothetical protein
MSQTAVSSTNERDSVTVYNCGDEIKLVGMSLREVSLFRNSIFTFIVALGNIGNKTSLFDAQAQ